MASSDQVFTAHSILLPDGDPVRPSFRMTLDAPLLVNSGICQAALRDLELALPNGGTVADLGCLEGGYAAAFAQAGYEVTGFEAHPENMDCCRFVERSLNLPNLRFKRMDVRDLDEEFDAVFCCGLLYHLDNPAAFLQKLGKLTRRLLIVQTHYSTLLDAEHEGRRGHWYAEKPNRWSSHGNMLSFWLGKRELLAAMYDAEFGLVYEQADYLDDVLKREYGTEQDRGMFVGIKP